VKLLQEINVVFLPLVACGCYPVANLHFGLKAPHFLDLPAFGVADSACRENDLPEKTTMASGCLSAVFSQGDAILKFR
jgi:hypothetical protein